MRPTSEDRRQLAQGRRANKNGRTTVTPAQSKDRAFTGYFEGTIFTGDAGEKFFWLMFIMVTYRLAFGRNDDGDKYIESGVSKMGDGFNRHFGPRADKVQPKARLQAEATGVSVTRHKPSRTARYDSETGRRVVGRRNATTDVRTDAERATSADRARAKKEAEELLVRRGLPRTDARAALDAVPTQQTKQKYVEEAMKQLVRG